MAEQARDRSLAVELHHDMPDLVYAKAKQGHGSMLALAGEEKLEVWDVPIIAETLSKSMLGKDTVAKEGLTMMQLRDSLAEPVEDKDKDKKEAPKSVQKGPKEPTQTIKHAGDELRIRFEGNVFDKIKCWVNMTTEEISGLGCVKRESDGSFYVYDIFLVKQENTGSFTDIDDEALHALMFELMQLDDEDGGSRFGDLKFWWHSHADMGVFWSGQDDKCIREKMENADWWLSAVFNRKDAIKTRLDIKNPPMQFDDLEWRAERYISADIEEVCREEYDAKVTEKSWRGRNCSYGTGFYQGQRSTYPSSRIPGLSKYHDNYATGAHRKNFCRKTPNQAAATGRKTPFKETTGLVTSGGVTPIPTPQTQATQRPQEPQAKGSITSQNWGIVAVPGTSRLGVDLQRCTPDRADLIYKDEIDTLVKFLEDNRVDMGLGKVEITGRGYYPRIIDTHKIDSHIKWTFTGKIRPTDNTYVIMAWKDDPGMLYLAKVTGLYYDSVQIHGAIQVAEHLFSTVGIDYEPDTVFFDVGLSEYDLDMCVGIFFETGNSILKDDLGQNFVIDLQSHVQDYIDTEFEMVEEQEQPNDEEEQEEVDAVEQSHEVYRKDVEKYTCKAKEKDLEDRIYTLLHNLSDRQLQGLLADMAYNMGEDADEQSIEDDAEYMDYNQAMQQIAVFTSRDPKEAFYWVWYHMPSQYWCSECFQPVAEDQEICPYCKTKLPEGESD